MKQGLNQSDREERLGNRALKCVMDAGPAVEDRFADEKDKQRDQNWCQEYRFAQTICQR
jgi:hypothetical protein